jgi:CubicO group peptidase (beta-lactamase class C family)
MQKIGFTLAFLLYHFMLMAHQPTLSQLKVAEQQITLLSNKTNLIPLQALDSLNILSVSIGKDVNNDFNDMMRKYLIVENIAFDSTSTTVFSKKLLNKNLIIISLYKSELNAEDLIRLNNLIKNNKKVVLCTFVPLQKWMTKLTVDAWISAFDSQLAYQQMAAQLIFGGIRAQGKLNQSFGNLKKGFGCSTVEPIRLKYTLPDELGIDGNVLTHKIDSLVNDAISQQTFPGCVVLVAKDAKVIFNKAYGSHTYFHPDFDAKTKDPLHRSEDIYDLFDLASLTKIIAGVPAYIKLVDEGKIDVEEKFSHYFPLFQGTNKENITVKELLCHVGGLQPYIGFYKRMVRPDGTLNPDFIRSDSTSEYPIRISPILFIRKDIASWVYDSIARSPLLKQAKHKLVYSDLPYVLTPPVIESITNQTFESFLQQTFYRPLGATEIGYQPLLRFPLARIVPTEQDTYFRQTLLQGYVHDESSAILGSHSANAGLFANANDLAKLLQLLLQKGEYGGKRYFRKETFQLFNSTPYAKEGIYRGIGFEKPTIKNGQVVGTSYLSPLVSPESFGHTGYTGTMFWVDPTYNLVYIFLSNRVFPTRDSDKMFTTRIRAKVQTAIYDALK